MDLAFNLLLIILLELPIAGFFFRSKKRKPAYMVALLANLITWPIVNAIRLNTDLDLKLVQIGVVLLEGFAFWFFMKCRPGKALLISLVANLVSFVVTKFVYLPADFFQKKPDTIIH